jgi:hypothetical protein
MYKKARTRSSTYFMIIEQKEKWKGSEALAVIPFAPPPPPRYHSNFLCIISLVIHKIIMII